MYAFVIVHVRLSCVPYPPCVGVWLCVCVACTYVSFACFSLGPVVYACVLCVCLFVLVCVYVSVFPGCPFNCACVLGQHRTLVFIRPVYKSCCVLVVVMGPGFSLCIFSFMFHLLYLHLIPRRLLLFCRHILDSFRHLLDSSRHLLHSVMSLLTWFLEAAV